MKTNISEKRIQILGNLKEMTGISFAMSNFVPNIICGQIVDVAFLYPANTVITLRTRPFAKVAFEHSTGALLEYSNCYLNDFMNADKYPLDTKIDYSLAEIKSALDAKKCLKCISELYDNVCNAFLQNDLSKKMEIATFMENFYKTAPIDTLDFYKQLSPTFFEWAEKLICDNKQ